MPLRARQPAAPDETPDARSASNVPMPPTVVSLSRRTPVWHPGSRISPNNRRLVPLYKVFIPVQASRRLRIRADGGSDRREQPAPSRPRLFGPARVEAQRRGARRSSGIFEGATSVPSRCSGPRARCSTSSSTSRLVASGGRCTSGAWRCPSRRTSGGSLTRTSSSTPRTGRASLARSTRSLPRSAPAPPPRG